MKPACVYHQDSGRGLDVNLRRLMQHLAHGLMGGAIGLLDAVCA
jgi:hypothetical protein